METGLSPDVITAAPVVTPVAPVVAATPAPAATPAVAVPPTDGSGGKIMDVLKSFNWIEIGFGILGATALFYTIYYYKYNINTTSVFKNEIKNKVDELNIKLADMQSSLESKNTQQQPQVFV